LHNISHNRLSAFPSIVFNGTPKAAISVQTRWKVKIEIDCLMIPTTDGEFIAFAQFLIMNRTEAQEEWQQSKGRQSGGGKHMDTSYLLMYSRHGY
jgi:hypothetical protein